MNDLETLRLDDGAFHFKLCYPDLLGYDNPCNEWTQTSNPVTNTPIRNFRPVYLTFPKNSQEKDFGGIGLSSEKKTFTLIQDTSDTTTWWFAIGALRFQGGDDTIPGPSNIYVKKVELYAEKSGRFAKQKL